MILIDSKLDMGVGKFSALLMSLFDIKKWFLGENAHFFGINVMTSHGTLYSSLHSNFKSAHSSSARVTIPKWVPSVVWAL